MKKSNWNYLWVIMALMAFSSCSNIIGTKTQRVKLYLQTDSVTVITEHDIIQSKSPMRITVETRRPTIDFYAVQNGDTTLYSFQRRVRDFCVLEPVFHRIFMKNRPDRGLAYTFPRKIYLNFSPQPSQKLSAFPTSRKGWTRITFGGFFTNRMALDGRENSSPLSAFPSYRLGLEHFVSDNFSISSDMGYFGGTSSRNDAIRSFADTSYSVSSFINHSFFSYHKGRFSIGAGLSFSLTDFRTFTGYILGESKPEVTFESYRFMNINPVFRANFWLRPKSSLFVTYTPAMGIRFNERTASFINFGWNINLPLLQPSIHRAKKTSRFAKN